MGFLNTSLLLALATALGGCAVYPEPLGYDSVYNNGYGNVYTQPPTVIYQQPAPMHVTPRPVYVPPRPVYVIPPPLAVERNRYGYGGYRDDRRGDYDRSDRRPPPGVHPPPRQQAHPQRPPQVNNRQPRRPLQSDDPKWQLQRPVMRPDFSKN